MRLVQHWSLSLLVCILSCLPLAAQDNSKDKDKAKDGKNSGFRFVFKDNPSFRFGKILRIDLRAKGQADFRSFSPDLQTDEGRFDLQRVRFGVEGTFLKDIEYEVEREFRESFGGLPSKSVWRDVDVNFRYLRNFQVKAGKFKVPFSLEQNTSTHNLDFVFRSRVADELAPGRDTGVAVHGRFFDRGLNYDAGVFRRDGENENADASDAESHGERMYAGRVTGTPLRLVKAPGFMKDLELGISSTRTNMPEGLNGMRGKTTSGDTFFKRIYIEGTRFRLGTELNWNTGPFSVKSEFIHTSDQRLNQSLKETDLPPLVARGWYVTGTWVITGEKKSGAVEPAHPLITSHGIGAIELAGRYEQLRFGSSEPTGPTGPTGLASRSPRASNILGNSDRVWTAGVNWYPNHFTKVQINGIHDKIEDIERSPAGNRTNYWMGILRIQFVM